MSNKIISAELIYNFLILFSNFLIHDNFSYRSGGAK